MVNYSEKYFKYKSKYLKLKLQIMNKNMQFGGNEYIKELKKLYPECVHDNGSLKDATKYQEQGYATTYGEMDYPAIEKLNNEFNSNNEIKYFIDFGSGRGKLPLFMADKVNKSIGIELVTERHNDAVKLKETLSKKFKEITNKVELINGDMFKYLDTINKSTFDGPVLIWISNLCFEEKLTRKLFDKLIEKMPEGTIIGSSKIPDEKRPEIEPVHFADDNEGVMNVPMSWSKNSTIYVFRLK